MGDSALLQPGDWVGWLNFQQAKSRGWLEAFGPGPFPVVRVEGQKVVLMTRAGEQEISATRLAWRPRQVDPVLA
jgi:hypothetical protein